MSFSINRSQLPPVQGTGQISEKFSHKGNKASFQSVLDREIQKTDDSIRISGHASRRLMERNITLNENDLKALSRTMNKAYEKGAKDSLMLYKDIAFIASIKNRTLITAIDPKDSEEHIFTNIDSAVIVK